MMVTRRLWCVDVAAFSSDSLTDRDLRVALRYEVGRFYGSVERLKKAIAKQALEDAYSGEFFCLLFTVLSIRGRFFLFMSILD